jgi:DinB superfamily
MTNHAERVARIGAGFDEAMARLVARIERAGNAAAAEPPDGGWSAAQIAWHVAAVNDAFANLMSGGRRAFAAPPEFTETDWRQLATQMPSGLQAPAYARPPADVDPRDALARLRASGERLSAAIAALTPERGAMGIQTGSVGTISIYQVGEWATGHAIRHNRQAKRALGEG